MSSRLIVANWKSNKTSVEVTEWLDEFDHLLKNQPSHTDVHVVIAPPFLFLPMVAGRIKKLPHCSLAVQDISPFPAGSYTGAVSSYNLSSLSVSHAIVGHSERRRYFHETHADVAAKVAQAVEAGITPIVCVDEEYVALQASAIAVEHLSKCVVAYEPLGAIGSGKNADVGTVKRVVTTITRAFGDVKVIYGGSVDERNIGEYLLVTRGVLVGGASLAANQFSALLEAAGS